MMMSLGPVVFNLRLNATGTSEDVEPSFARHDVFGGYPIFEDTGEHETTMTVSGVLFPEFSGGLVGLEALKTAASVRIPLPFMRGDFVPLGWVILQRVSVISDRLNIGGVGRHIEFDVELTKTGTPGVSAAQSILGLFR